MGERRVVILGSTGSIGENALRVIERFPGRLSVAGLATGRNVGRVLEQAVRWGVGEVAVGDEAAARECERLAPAGVRVRSGSAGVTALAGEADADMVLCALVGMAGLRPTLAALGAGRDVALATKEVLVSAGWIVRAAAAAAGARILPVDSEHSAIHQCLAGVEGDPCDAGGRVRRVVLTGSGGPFFGMKDLDWEGVTPEQALNHPRWRMGSKVTVDSATMMNKGLEVLEARWLFDVPLDRIDVVIHPESIVHSLVEFPDGSMLAQMSRPDMRFAIQYALLYPERFDGGLPPLDLAALGVLHFHVPDHESFPCLGLARAAAEEGGTMPAVMNAANEVGVERFLRGEARFPSIWRTVEETMRRHVPVARAGLEDVEAADRWARREAGQIG